MACLLCGHVGGWESRPAQSPAALVQKFMVPERVMVEQRLDGNFLSYRGVQGSVCLGAAPGALGVLALLLQV